MGAGHSDTTNVKQFKGGLLAAYGSFAPLSADDNILIWKATMEKATIKRHPILICAIVGLIGLGILLALNFFTGEAASEEWIYTLEWINIFGEGILIGLAVFMGAWGFSMLLRSRKSKMVWVWCAAICAIMFAIPFFMPDYLYLAWQYQYFLSLCWACALLAGSLCLFSLAVNKSSFMSSLLCLVGSVGMGLSALELALLCTSQFADGMEYRNSESKHAQLEKGVPEHLSWTPWQCGMRPAAPGKPLPAFHRLLTKGRDLFDVKYTFNSDGWRIMPDGDPDAKNDLLLFGCSFTFGIGLEDEQTWPWKLAKLLGRDWQVDNYSAGGWSINHTLCMLEHHLIEKPGGANRYALFLAIDHHLRRNEVFPSTPHYELNEAGEAVAKGKARFNFAFMLPHTFNGSQLARETGSFVIGALMKHPEEAINIYLAMIRKCAAILEKEYGTKLIVLLWPDMEFLKDRLEEMDITVLLVRPMLAEWDTPEDNGHKYRISRLYEPHPNDLATTELAVGLARYFKDLAQKQAN